VTPPCWPGRQVWRNHLPTVEHLLEVDAAVDLQDGESGWCACASWAWQ